MNSPAPLSVPSVDAPAEGREQGFQRLVAKLLAQAPSGEPAKLGIALEQLEPYLTVHGRDARSLVAAFGLTGEESLLREALERFPRDPSVLEIAFATAAEGSRLDLARRLEAASPDNAFGSMAVMGELFASGDKEGAIEALLRAGTKEKFGTCSADREQALREALLLCGFGSAEASAASMRCDRNIPLRCCMACFDETAARVREELTSGSPERAVAMAEGALRLSDTLKTDRQLLGRLLARPLEEKVLRALPGDTVVRPDGATAAAQLEGLPAAYNAGASSWVGCRIPDVRLAARGVWAGNANAEEFVPKMTSNEFEIFAQIRSERGYFEAMEWVAKLIRASDPK